MLDWDLRPQLEREVENIRTTDRVRTHPNSVQTEIIENVHGRAETRGFTFEYDEPRHVTGGQDRGPRPLEYFLAGYAFCQQVMYARSALLTGTDVDALWIDVTGRIDPRSSIHEGDIPAGFVDDEIDMTTNIVSDAPREDVAELVRRARSLCHAHASLQREMRLENDVVLNGDPFEV